MNFHENVSKIMIILFNLSSTSSHLHPLQVENWNSNSQVVVGIYGFLSKNRKILIPRNDKYRI